MNNPFDYHPDEECCEAFGRLLNKIEQLKENPNTYEQEFLRELEAGKMLGVLVATDKESVHHTLYAFSGQIGNYGFDFPGFVGPVFDYLSPDGYFKTKEREISNQNAEIHRYKNGEYAKIKSAYDSIKRDADAEIEAAKEKCRLSKSARKARRESGNADDTELAQMIRQSQHEKAELHRLKKRLTAELSPYSEKLEKAKAHLESLRKHRKSESEDLQQWLFDHFRLLNARGESRSLSEIFATTSVGIPPSGAGECCGPKLLQAAYQKGWKPLSIAEFWYGAPKDGEVRRHGQHYPACRGKCLPILTWMLQGLEINPPLSEECNGNATSNPEIIYENDWFCVASKPSGMLSVPGKGKAKSLQDWLIEKYGAGREVKVAHRLDQDTSGLIIATFGESSYKLMQTLFATRRVKKTYIAILEGDYLQSGIPHKGNISLPLSPDWLDRPRQRVDFENGKEAETEYEFKGVENGRSRVLFHPATGRTHQLRVHAASAEGLGMPIVGDRLYGSGLGHTTDRLHLHAKKIEFTFPIDKKHYCFEIPDAF